MKKEEITKLGLVDSHILIVNQEWLTLNMTDYGVFVEEKDKYSEKKYYSLVSESKIKKLDTLELNIITEELFLKHLERNRKILNGAHRELENVLYSKSKWFTPKNFVNLNLSDAMTQYFNEVYNIENIVDDEKPKFTEHFMLLYNQYPSSFLNSYPKNKRKEITDYLLNPINIKTKKEKIKDKTFEINKGIIIDKNEEYLIGKSLFFKNFSKFLSEKAKERKPISISYLLKKLDRDMPKLARLAMLDIQSDIEESQRQQEEAKKIISEKYYI